MSEDIITKILDRDNLNLAFKNVKANCRRGYKFVAHSKILQNAITKLALSKPNKKKGRRGLVFALDYYLA